LLLLFSVRRVSHVTSSSLRWHKFEFGAVTCKTMGKILRPKNDTHAYIVR
jgi:hypothetical protein